jgi:hypothetical protein
MKTFTSPVNLDLFKRAIILEGKTMRYNNWRPKNMPEDRPSYLVGRTDERVLTMFCSGTKN